MSIGDRVVLGVVLLAFASIIGLAAYRASTPGESPVRAHGRDSRDDYPQPGIGFSISNGMKPGFGISIAPGVNL